MASVMHEQTGVFPIITVHAEQDPRSQTIFVPVRCSSSRSASASVVRGSRFRRCAWPLTRSVTGTASGPCTGPVCCAARSSSSPTEAAPAPAKPADLRKVRRLSAKRDFFSSGGCLGPFGFLGSWGSCDMQAPSRALKRNHNSVVEGMRVRVVRHINVLLPSGTPPYLQRMASARDLRRSCPLARQACLARNVLPCRCWGQETVALPSHRSQSDEKAAGDRLGSDHAAVSQEAGVPARIHQARRPQSSAASGLCTERLRPPPDRAKY